MRRGPLRCNESLWGEYRVNLNGFSPLTQTYHPVISSSALSARGLRSERLVLEVLSAGAANICCRSGTHPASSRGTTPAPSPRHAWHGCALPRVPLEPAPSVSFMGLSNLGHPLWGQRPRFRMVGCRRGRGARPALPVPPARGGGVEVCGGQQERRKRVSFLHTAATCFASQSSSLARK